MRMVPQKRPHAQVSTPTEVKYVPFGGGLNLIDSPITMDDGMLTECLNFEQVFGRQGYSRINGFERYDGRPEPHLATYSIQYFDGGTAAISAGDVVTGASATAKVLAVEITSGSWGTSDAAGRLIIYNTTGAWADNEAIQVSAATKALANGVTTLGAVSEANHLTYKNNAIAARRSAIAAVAGSGSVLGIGVANNVGYAVRNVADGTSATLYKATASGWTSVRTGLYPGGSFKMIQANFSGSTTSIYLFGCDGKNRSWKFDGTTFSFMDPIFGSQATSTSSNTVGTGAKTFVVAQTTRSWATNDTLIIWSTSNAANWMRGTVTSYTSGTNTLVMNITSTGGSGTITDWEVGKSDFSDKPYDMLAHRDHMFLSYPYGQLQTSDLGNPMTYTTSSLLFGMGDELAGLVSIRGGVLAVYCNNKLELIEGSTKSTWARQINSNSSGAKLGTVQEIAQTVMSLDIGGLSSLQATLNYGSFEQSTMSRYVKPYMDLLYDNVIGSRVVRAKNQYRIYTSSGEFAIVTLLTPNAIVTPDDISITRGSYGKTISAIGYGEISGDEYLFFGDSDGYVYRENVGASFDGEIISSVIRTPFLSLKSPSNKKRFRKIVLEIDAAQQTNIYFRQLFDYADGNYATAVTGTAVAYGGGGQWNSDDWNNFSWSLPVQTQAEANIDGVGRNMGILFWHESATDDPFNLQGLLIHHSTIGMTR